MGSYLDYRCTQCSFQASIGGPEEFYLADGGAPGAERRPYGHPVALTDEAQERGVDGFWMHLWCPACAVVRTVVTVEFTKPCDPLDAWAGRTVFKPGYPADMERCPQCSAELEDEIPGASPVCPACRAGRLTAGRAVT